MRFRPSVLSVLLLFSVSLGISANAVAESSIAERVANQKSLRISVEAGEGKFARLTAIDKAGLLSAQDRIFEILDGVPAESELTGPVALASLKRNPTLPGLLRSSTRRPRRQKWSVLTKRE